jgi:hypothetical protein
MKKKFNKYYIAFFYLCANFVLYADPGSGNETDDLESVDAPTSPIDDYIWFLAIIGLIYIFLKLRALNTKENKFNNSPILED